MPYQWRKLLQFQSFKKKITACQSSKQSDIKQGQFNDPCILLRLKRCQIKTDLKANGILFMLLYFTHS